MFGTIYLPIITPRYGQTRQPKARFGNVAVGLAVDIIIAIVMVVIHSLLILQLSTYWSDRGLSSWDSMKLSARAVMKNIGGIAA